MKQIEPLSWLPSLFLLQFYLQSSHSLTLTYILWMPKVSLFSYKFVLKTSFYEDYIPLPFPDDLLYLTFRNITK